MIGAVGMTTLIRPTPIFVALGIRTPMLIISPYVTKGTNIVSQRLQSGSIADFIENAFDLPSLSSLSANGSSLGTPVPTKYSCDTFLDQPASNVPAR